MGFDRDRHVVDWPPLRIEFARRPGEGGRERDSVTLRENISGRNGTFVYGNRFVPREPNNDLACRTMHGNGYTDCSVSDAADRTACILLMSIIVNVNGGEDF